MSVRSRLAPLRRRARRSIEWTRDKRPLHWARTRLADRGAVLMYHSIGSVDLDPWGLYVSPEHFAQHLEVLRSTASPRALGTLADQLEAGDIGKRAVAVTFDDGYVNNLELAEPMLADAGVPATVFIVTSGVGSDREYWWDRLAAAVLRPAPLPATLALDLPNGSVVLDIGTARDYDEAARRSEQATRDGEGPASARMQLYRRLWELLVPLPDPDRQAALDVITDWCDHEPPTRDTHRVVTAGELLRLEASDAIDIGGHTITHPLLPAIDRDSRWREIDGGKRDLEELLGRSVDLFSYPFGAHDDATVAATARAGYRAAVTTRPETVSAATGPHRIPRFDVKDWDGEEFERRLDRWLRFR